MKLLDLKLQLLDSKLELLDSKIKTWESKPEELDIKLEELDNGFHELDSRLVMLDFDPESFNAKFSLLDSILISQKKNISEPKIKGIVSLQYDTVIPRQFSSVISLNPVRVFEGTFQLSYEKVINSRNSLDISGLATYATDQGISRRYLIIGLEISPAPSTKIFFPINIYHFIIKSCNLRKGINYK